MAPCKKPTAKMLALPQSPRPGLSAEGKSKGKSKEKFICDPGVLVTFPGAPSPDGGDVNGGGRGESGGPVVVEKHARLRKTQRVSYAVAARGLGCEAQGCGAPAPRRG